MESSRQEYWIGMPFPSPGDLPDPEIKPGSPALQADALPLEPQGSSGSPFKIHPYSSLSSPFVPLMIPTPGPSFPSDCAPHMILQDHDCLGHIYRTAPNAVPGSKQGLVDICLIDNFFKAK